MTGPSPVAVVVNYATSSSVAALLQQLPPDWSAVVVDNYSSDAERRAVHALASPRVQVVDAPNDGFAAGVNRGVRLADPDAWCVLLNPDAVVTPEAMALLVDEAGRRGYGLASPLVLRPDGTVWFGGGRLSRWTGRVEHVGFGRPLDALPPHPVPLDFVSGCVLALAPEARRAVGAWDERYFMYYEDVDYSVRARRAGVRLGLVREARAVHDEGGSSAGAGERSPLYYRYQARNRLLFAALHLARWRAVASTPYVLARSAATIVRHEPRRVSKLAAAARGSLDGLRLALRAR